MPEAPPRADSLDVPAVPDTFVVADVNTLAPVAAGEVAVVIDPVSAPPVELPVKVSLSAFSTMVAVRSPFRQASLKADGVDFGRDWV